MRTLIRSAKNLGASLCLLGAAACAGDVVDVDRTQANRIDKSIFEGEWYFRPVVLETQYSQGILFEGLEGEADRVRFKLTESELIAYRSYELLEGAETGTGDTEFYGNPVARFAIESHFDVMREYNPATGEQTNVLVENTTDRPWYERKYVRVDWSQNLHGDPYSLAAGVQSITGAPYYVQEHEIDNPYRAEVTATNINVVNNYVLMADMDTCYGLGLDPYFCNATNAKMKLSFMKVGERNYEPLYYPDYAHVVDPATGRPFQTDANGYFCNGQAGTDLSSCTKVGLPMFARFGFFRTERRAYDNEYQWTRDNRIFLANRWNLWKKYKDGAGNVLPEDLRETKPIVYTANVDHPEDAEVWEGTNAIAADWDRAFRETVLELKNQRLRKAGQPELTIDAIDTMYKIEKNRCNVADATRFAEDNDLEEELEKYGIAEIQKGNLERACAVLEAKSASKKNTFTWQKQGDLRHSFVVWVDTPQNAGPLGYGPLAADPITGETISANANVYGAAIDSYAAYAADVVALMNGDITIDELATGESVREQLAGRAPSFGAFSAMKMASMQRRFKEQAQDMGERWFPRASEQQQQFNRQKLERVKRSDLEREVLTNDELKRAMLGPTGYQPGQAQVDPSFSPLAFMTDGEMKRFTETRIKLGKQAIDMANWSDEGMASLAKDLEGMAWDDVYTYMRRELHRSVTAHEVGHTLGLRHNFEGSYDALNYHPEFWESYNRTTGKVDREDPITGEPTTAERLMYSTIMDYDARFYADSTAGIGPYDRAAIKFGYGKLVEVFSENVAPYSFGTLQYLYDYQDLPKLLAGDLSCDAINNSDNRSENGGINLPESQCPAVNNDAFGNLLDPNNPYGDVDYFQQALEGIDGEPANVWAREYVRFDDLYEQYVGYYAYFTGQDTEFKLPNEVPYLFCPDEWSYSSNVTCQPYDKGANYTELMQDRAERYDKYYFFTNFRRDRVSFNSPNALGNYLNRLYARFFAPMSDVYRYYLYGFSGIGYNSAGDYLTLADFPIGADWQSAAMTGLNELVSVIEQPEPGRHCLDDKGNADPSDDVYVLWETNYEKWTDDMADFEACPEPLDVPLGIGKYFDTTWTDEYIYKATRIGTFYDKYAALVALTSNEGSFYRNFSDLLDQGSFVLSYWRALDGEMLDFFSSAFRGEASEYAWRYDAAAPEGQQYGSVPLVDIFEDGINPSAPRIEPAGSWTLRYNSVLLPMARFNSLYDYTPDFSGFVRVCLEGYIDCQDFDGPEVSTVTYVDPLTSFRYVAPELDSATMDDEGMTHPNRSIGARLLEEAADYAAQYPAVKGLYDDTVTSPDDFVLTEDEKTYLEAPAATTAADLTDEQKDEVVFQRLRAWKVVERGINERTSFIDVVRRLTYLTEFGG